MLNPAEMKNKGEIISAINAAQSYFGESLSAISSSVNRPALETILLAYVERYREKEATTPIEDEKVKGFETIECPACEGSGIYAPNGGPCFRCTGKGHQNEADQKRNYGYDLHHQHPIHVKSDDTGEQFDPEPHIKGQVPTRVEDYDEDDIPF